ncbi:MAG: CCA tRNA nucleotidyltransferase [Actinobacteria bacterium]|nr:MAG: CCA tRNA nucleotidyltransferase [Actinomycetota bacterium]
MDERVRAAVAGQEAYVVGGAVRDELLGRRVVDLDVACRDPEGAAGTFGRLAGGALFRLSERHGAWRVAFSDGRTVDFTPLRDGIEDDLGSRDFTINAIAVPVEGGEPVDPFGGRADLEAGRVRAVSSGVFADDPLRLLRAVRFEDELAFRMDERTEAAVRAQAEFAPAAAGERILDELLRLSSWGYARLAELGLLDELGGTASSLDVPVDTPEFRLVWFLGEAVERLPVSNELRRYARTIRGAQCPADASAREIHRFRRATEPWALDAVHMACGGRVELLEAVERARSLDPEEPLLRGDELGLPEGPEVGRILELIAEERAAGTITTREEALKLAHRERAGPD